MPEKTSYIISLEIENSDRVNASIDSIDRKLYGITENAKSLNFKDALEGVKALEQQMTELSSSEEDCTAEWERFEKASNKAYAELERAAVRLNHSISESGRLQRERIAELEKEKASLDKTAESKARAKEIDKEIRQLRKEVVSGTDEELQAQLKMNREARGRLKLLQQESKAQKAQGKEQKTLAQLIKEDLKPLRDKLKLQKEFILILQN